MKPYTTTPVQSETVPAGLLSCQEKPSQEMAIELQAIAIGHIIEETLDAIYKRDKQNRLSQDAVASLSIQDLIQLEMSGYHGSGGVLSCSLAAKALIAEIAMYSAQPLFLPSLGERTIVN